MKKSKIVWYPASPRPYKAGTYLVWSEQNGVRLTSFHPDWWNGNDPYAIGKVTMYAYLGESFPKIEMRALATKLSKKKKTTVRRSEALK